MHFFTTAVALFASLALAQQNAINIPSGQSTLDITAGQPETITWTNPSSGTVTIKLQESGPNITPQSGIVLASGIPASAETATFTIDPKQVNTFQYTIEIIDDSNTSNINFSPNFGIANAQSTATGTLTGSSTASMTSGSSTATGSTNSTMSVTNSASSTSSTASSTGSSTTDSSSSSPSSSSSAASTQTTSAPSSSNGGADLKVQGGLVAVVAVAVAIL